MQLLNIGVPNNLGLLSVFNPTNFKFKLEIY